MTDILSLFACFDQSIDKTRVKQLSHFVLAMLGIARWAEKGGSYRRVQRFFAKALPWAAMQFLFVRHHLLRSGGAYIIAGDESVVTKAGKKRHGLDRLLFPLWTSCSGSGLLCALVNQRRRTPVVSPAGRTTAAQRGGEADLAGATVGISQIRAKMWNRESRRLIHLPEGAGGEKEKGAFVLIILRYETG